MMYRLRRLVRAMSLLLSLGVVALWIRSYWIEDRLGLQTYTSISAKGHPRNYDLIVQRGRMSLVLTRYEYFGYGGEPGWTWIAEPVE
ncbi:MAG TPA: hypothetical protein VH475_14380, partial [Tepidisphaeraceae bacterium]